MAAASKGKVAPSGTSSVVRLPSAAPRQVVNWRFAAQRRAAIALKAASPFKDRYVHPHDRAARALAQQAMGIEQTPALILVSAILRAMDAEAVAKVANQLASAGVSGNRACQQALATFRISRMNVGQELDFLRALDVLRTGGC